MRHAEQETAVAVSPAIAFEKIEEIPADFNLIPKRLGLKVVGVQVYRLTGHSMAKQLFQQSMVSFMVGNSVAQALGAVPFIGRGTTPEIEKEVKLIADTNAVSMGEAALLRYSELHPNEIFVVIGGEGEKDGSFALLTGDTYKRGQKETYSERREGPEGKAERVLLLAKLLKRLALYEKLGYTIRYIVDDALENTNGAMRPEAAEPDRATNSTSLSALFFKHRGFLHDLLRTRGITYHGPEAGVKDDDLPSVALPKIAKAVAGQRWEDMKDRDRMLIAANQGKDQWVREQIIDYINNANIFILGSRTASQSKQKGTDLRHRAIWEDAEKMQTLGIDLSTYGFGAHPINFPHMKIIKNHGDGDCMPRIFAALGLNNLVVFGRGGQEELAAVTLAAKMAGGRFPQQIVSSDQTNTDVLTLRAKEFTSAELAMLHEVGMDENAYGRMRDVEHVEGDGIVVMTSVTGASEDIFGPYARLLQRVKIEGFATGDGGIVTANTLVVTREGSYAVRTKFKTEDLEITRHLMARGGQEAVDKFTAEHNIAPLSPEKLHIHNVDIRGNLIGPQGSGKGTQSLFLKAFLGVLHLESQPILRADPQMIATINSGALVKDDIVNGAWQAVLDNLKDQLNIITDGYPRTVPQLNFFIKYLAKAGKELDFIIDLVASLRTSFHRTLRVRKGRADDVPESVRRRLREFRRNTVPTARELRARFPDRYIEVDANDGNATQVFFSQIRPALLKLLHRRANGITVPTRISPSIESGYKGLRVFERNQLGLGQSKLLDSPHQYASAAIGRRSLIVAMYDTGVHNPFARFIHFSASGHRPDLRRNAERSKGEYLAKILSKISNPKAQIAIISCDGDRQSNPRTISPMDVEDFLRSKGFQNIRKETHLGIHAFVSMNGKGELDIYRQSDFDIHFHDHVGPPDFAPILTDLSRPRPEVKPSKSSRPTDPQFPANAA